jgi:hypothetical protein
MPPPEDPLERLHRDLGFKRLNPVWAKLEILVGLFTVGFGLISGMHFTQRELHPLAWFGPVLLIAFGGYLALAGHRSHLYQSNNRLAAHLADLIRSHQQKPENSA